MGRRSRLTQVDFGIVTNVQAAGLSLYLGIAADQRMGKYDIVEIGEGADNGIL
jgi:hypothetical protein